MAKVTPLVAVRLQKVVASEMSAQAGWADVGEPVVPIDLMKK